METVIKSPLATEAFIPGEDVKIPKAGEPIVMEPVVAAVVQTPDVAFEPADPIPEVPTSRPERLRDRSASFLMNTGRLLCTKTVEYGGIAADKTKQHAQAGYQALKEKVQDPDFRQRMVNIATNTAKVAKSVADQSQVMYQRTGRPPQRSELFAAGAEAAVHLALNRQRR